MRARSPPPVLLPVFPSGTKSGPSLPPTLARRTAPRDARDFPQAPRSARSMPTSIPAPPIRTLRTPPTPQPLHGRSTPRFLASPVRNLPYAPRLSRQPHPSAKRTLLHVLDSSVSACHSLGFSGLANFIRQFRSARRGRSARYATALSFAALSSLR